MDNDSLSAPVVDAPIIVDDASVEVATAALIAGDRAPLDRWARESGFPPVRVAWGDAIRAVLHGQTKSPMPMSRSTRPRDPADDGSRGVPYHSALGTTIDPAAAVTGLLDWYGGLDRPGDGGLPAKRLIRPETLARYLGHLLLLDVLEGGLDFRYRLYGSEVARTARMDPTGRRFSEIAERTPLAFLYHVTYRAAVRRADPLLCDHYAQAYLSAERWRRLILPFADADAPGETRYLLVAKLPVGFKVEAEADKRFVDW